MYEGDNTPFMVNWGIRTSLTSINRIIIHCWKSCLNRDLIITPEALHQSLYAIHGSWQQHILKVKSLLTLHIKHTSSTEHYTFTGWHFAPHFPITLPNFVKFCQRLIAACSHYCHGNCGQSFLYNWCVWKYIVQNACMLQYMMPLFLIWWFFFFKFQ